MAAGEEVAGAGLALLAGDGARAEREAEAALAFLRRAGASLGTAFTGHRLLVETSAALALRAGVIRQGAIRQGAAAIGGDAGAAIGRELDDGRDASGWCDCRIGGSG